MDCHFVECPSVSSFNHMTVNYSEPSNSFKSIKLIFSFPCSAYILGVLIPTEVYSLCGTLPSQGNQNVLLLNTGNDAKNMSNTNFILNSYVLIIQNRRALRVLFRQLHMLVTLNKYFQCVEHLYIYPSAKWETQ